MADKSMSRSLTFDPVGLPLWGTRLKWTEGQLSCDTHATETPLIRGHIFNMLSFLLFNQVSRSAADVHTFGCHRSNWKINNLTSISVIGALDYPLTPISGRRGKWRRPFRRLMECSSRTLKDDFGGLDEERTSEYDIKETGFYHKFKLRSGRRDDRNPPGCVSSRCSTAMFRIFVFFIAIISSQRARLFCLNSLCLCVSVAMWTIHYLVKCAVFRRQDKHPYLMILFLSLFSSILAGVQYVYIRSYKLTGFFFLFVAWLFENLCRGWVITCSTPGRVVRLPRNTNKEGINNSVSAVLERYRLEINVALFV